jgi:hypothetical protein
MLSINNLLVCVAVLVVALGAPSSVVAKEEAVNCVKRGDLACLKQALADGADINEQGGGEQTPIMSASLSGKAMRQSPPFFGCSKT